MSGKRITSPQNARLKSWVELQRDGNARRERGEFILEGRRLVRTALELGRVKTLLHVEKLAGRDPLIEAAREKGIETIELSAAAFRRLADVPSPQGLAVVAELPRFAPGDVFRPDALVLVAAGVQEPGNLGSMIRSCRAAGGTGFVALAPSADVFHPRSVRGSAGAVLALPSIRMTETDFLEAARRARTRLIAAATRGGRDFRTADYSPPAAIVIGSEAHGVGEILMMEAEAVTIPMAAGTESLNAAAAASVILFEAARSR